MSLLLTGTGAAAVVVLSALASAGLPALAAAAIVTVLVLGMTCWVIADAGRSANMVSADVQDEHEGDIRGEHVELGGLGADRPVRVHGDGQMVVLSVW
jgi:hypothetical protein